MDKINDLEAKAYIPVSEMAYKIDENLYSYYKDSDEWFCAQGNKTVKKVYKKKKTGEKLIDIILIGKRVEIVR